MNRDHTLLPLSSPNDSSVLEASLYPMYLANDDTHGNPERCEHYVNLLLRREANSWCDFAHDRDCSFAGVYQPPLPIGSEAFGEFIATSNFHSVWEFLGLEERPRLSKVRDGARRICSMSFAELVAYSFQLPNPIKDVDDIKQMCFRATFAWIFLINGIGFPEDYKVIAVDVINGQKLGWALGSMLYEINTLPWEFGEKPKNLVPDILGMIGLSDENGEAPHVVLLSFLLGAALAALGLSFGKERRRRTRRLRLDDCDSELAGLARSSLTRDYGSTTHS